METEQANSTENLDLRIRTFINGCWNCRNFYPEEMDEPGDLPFCILDGYTVSCHQACSDWINDV